MTTEEFIALPSLDLPLLDIDSPVIAFGLSESLPPYDSGWHSHNKHQILYAVKGTMHLEVAGTQWLLPPQRGAWIGAAVPHRVRTVHPSELRTVYLPTTEVSFPSLPPCSVFSVSALAREMILYAMRWDAHRSADNQLATNYFATLAGLAAGEWIKDALPFHLPAAQTSELAQAMEYALAHLDNLSLETTARATGFSPRTLARRFSAETKTTWRQWLLTARMLRAMDYLSIPGSRVTDAALEVGYDSLGAFSKAFSAFVGETPTEFRRRANV